jgi:hypothetical protein
VRGARAVCPGLLCSPHALDMHRSITHALDTRKLIFTHAHCTRTHHFTRPPRIDYTIEGLHGGALVGARGTDFVCFYDWGDGRLVRRIDVGE